MRRVLFYEKLQANPCCFSKESENPKPFYQEEEINRNSVPTCLTLRTLTVLKSFGNSKTLIVANNLDFRYNTSIKGTGTRGELQID
jgi:hypothetical protein